MRRFHRRLLVHAWLLILAAPTSALALLPEAPGVRVADHVAGGSIVDEAATQGTDALKSMTGATGDLRFPWEDELVWPCPAPALGGATCLAPRDAAHAVLSGRQINADVASADEPDTTQTTVDPGVGLYATPLIETSQYYSQYLTGEFSSEPGPEILLVTRDAFVAATDHAGNDVWRWTPDRFNAALGLEGSRVASIAFTGWSIDAYGLASTHLAAVADLNGDGFTEVWIGAVFFHIQRDPDAITGRLSTGLFLLDGKDGHALQQTRYEGYVRNLFLVDLNADGALDRVLVLETGPQYDWSQGWLLGGDPNATTVVEATDGRTGALLWRHDTGEAWTFVPKMEMGDLTGDGVPDAALALAHSAIGEGPNYAAPDWSLLALDGRTGAHLWDQKPSGLLGPVAIADGTLYGIVNEQKPSSEGALVPVRGTVAAWDGPDGKQKWQTGWDRAAVLDLQVGELGGAAGSEIAITLVKATPSGDSVEEASLRVLEAANGDQEWAHVETSPPDLLAPVFGPQSVRVMVTSRIIPATDGAPRLVTVLLNRAGLSNDILVFAGDDPLHQAQRIPGLFSFLNLAGAPGWVHVRAVGERIVPIHLEGLAVAQTPRLPFLGLLNGIQRADLNDDHVPDYVVGGDLSVVFAVDGAALPTVRVLWKAPCGVGAWNRIHEVQVAADAADRPVLFAVATDEICRLDPATGAVLWGYHSPPAHAYEQFVRIRVADLNGDGTPDVAAPGTRVLALDGATGRELWTFGMPTDNLGHPQGRLVYANAYSLLGQGDLNGDQVDDFAVEYVMDYPRNHLWVAALNGRTGEPFWRTVQAETLLVAMLWDSTRIGDLDGDGHAEVVVATFRSWTYPEPPGLNCMCVLVTAYDGLTGVPKWKTELNYVFLAMNGIRLLPRPDGTQTVLVLDLFTGWALLGPDGKILWEKAKWDARNHRVNGSRSPLDVQIFDANGDGQADVAEADHTGIVTVYEGRAFLAGRLEPLYGYRGLVGGALVLDPSTTTPTLLFAVFDFQGFAEKHGEAGILVAGFSLSRHGVGVLDDEAPLPLGDILAAPAKRDLPAPGLEAAAVVLIVSAAWAAARSRRAR